jgi:hypothetical protein
MICSVVADKPDETSKNIHGCGSTTMSRKWLHDDDEQDRQEEYRIGLLIIIGKQYLGRLEEIAKVVPCFLDFARKWGTNNVTIGR